MTHRRNVPPRRLVSGAALVFALTCLAAAPALEDSGLDGRLAPLQPLLGKTWRGMLKAPDGSGESTVTVRYDVMWNGTAVKYTRANLGLDSAEEGYFYWDDPAGKIAFFGIHSRGVVATGHVTVQGNVITLEGRMTWPAPPPNPAVRQSYDFRNVFTIASESGMTDEWFQNAFGDWRPGHRIVFRVN